MDSSTRKTNLPPIIAIDDSPDDLFILQRLVKHTGVEFPLLTFEDATKAAEYLTSAAKSANPAQVPCFIFTDLKMPTMTGFEFIEWLRTQRLIGELPVIVLSTSDDERDVRRAAELGVVRYYIKFPTADELAALLKKVRRGDEPRIN